MAAFNIPPPSTTTTTFSSLPSSYCHSNIIRTNYFNNDYNSNKKFSRGFHFSLFSSQTNPSSSSSSKTKRELSKMPTHFSKSGSFPGFLSFFISAFNTLILYITMLRNTGLPFLFFIFIFGLSWETEELYV